MRRRRRNGNQPTAAPSEDSFLDVVANLVGILIILVVVVGAHAGANWVQNEDLSEEQAALAVAEKDLVAAKAEARSRENHNLDVEAQIRQNEQIARLAGAQRAELLKRVTLAKQELLQKQANLETEDREQFEIQNEIADLQAALDEISTQTDLIRAQDTGPRKIDHLPTPIARTVFTDEVHFRLIRGRLAPVPLEELIDEMKNEWRAQANQLKYSNETVEIVGPIEGFRLQYKLQLVSKTIVSEYSQQIRQEPEFAGFVLVPISDELGTSLEEALQPNSWLDARIKRLDPEETTITVWVYPDSYREFAELKKHLYERGFLTAGWPLPEGMLISGGPNGFRSNAQ